jgi:hypothetical protein
MEDSCKRDRSGLECRSIFLICRAMMDLLKLFSLVWSSFISNGKIPVTSNSTSVSLSVLRIRLDYANVLFIASVSTRKATKAF